MKVKCKLCNYEWETKSKMYYITCPRCQRKTIVKEVKKEEGTQNEKS